MTQPGEMASQHGPITGAAPLAADLGVRARRGGPSDGRWFLHLGRDDRPQAEAAIPLRRNRPATERCRYTSPGVAWSLATSA
jgi:hypothetical protein